ncbi:MAG TPA: hypothetical protein VL147_16485 [Devosia sp.]|nr:hypothetical protein [Devosia sp.]
MELQPLNGLGLPLTPVSATARKLAEALLFDARRFIGPRGAMPVAAPDLAGLASQLGQALAGLEAYEGQHSVWDDVGKCFVWALPEQQTLPVKRLKPKVAPRPARDTAKMTLLRHKLARRMDARIEQEYERGLRDGLVQAARMQADAEAETEAEPAPPQTYPRLQNLA